MDNITFVIDNAKLSGLLKRSQANMLSNMAVIGVSVFVSQYLSYGSKDIKALILSFCITTPFILLIAIYSTKKRFRKTYETLKVVLKESGVELRAEGMPYRIITWSNLIVTWSNLIVKEEQNGIINLFDNRFSNFTRRLSGKGWIRIQPEIVDRDNLLNELVKRSQAMV